MEKPPKMNALFKIAFILLCVAAALLIIGIVVAYAFNKIYFSAVFTGSGCVLCFIGIILAMLSKPKKPKASKTSDEKFSVDTEENL